MNEDKYITYLRWLCTPQKEKFPKTLQEFLELNELTIVHITEFSNKASYFEDLHREAKNWGKSKLPQIIEKAYDSALSGKPQAVSAFAALLEDKKGAGVSINLGFNITEDQYERIIKREARLRHTGGEEEPLELLSGN